MRIDFETTLVVAFLGAHFKQLLRLAPSSVKSGLLKFATSYCHMLGWKVSISERTWHFMGNDSKRFAQAIDNEGRKPNGFERSFFKDTRIFDFFSHVHGLHSFLFSRTFLTFYWRLAAVFSFHLCWFLRPLFPFLFCTFSSLLIFF